jgi:hypothetical protein
MISDNGHSKDDVKDKALCVLARTIRELGPGLGLARWLARLRILTSAMAGAAPDGRRRKFEEIQRELPLPQNKPELAVRDAFMDAVESLQSMRNDGGADIENIFTCDVVRGLFRTLLDPHLSDLLGRRFKNVSELTGFTCDLYDGLVPDFNKLADQWLADPSGAKVRKPRSYRPTKSTAEHLRDSLL